MCLSGGGGDGGAGEARAREAERQNRIRQGMSEIEKIFGGYKKGVGAPGVPQPGQEYYLGDGTPITIQDMQVTNPAWSKGRDARGRPIVINNSGDSYQPQNIDGFDPAAPQFINQKSLVSNGKNIGAYGSQGLYTGVETVPGFDDAFFAQREQDYLNYAMPQLDDQKRDAQEKLIYALSRSGLLNSSVAGNKQGDLGEEYGRYQTDVGNAARGFSNDTRRDVESARNNLVNQLHATEDPAAAARGAVAQADILSKPPAFDPLGTFAFNVTEGLADTANRSRSQAYMAAPLSFGSSRKSSTVTRV